MCFSKVPPVDFNRNFRCEGVGVARRVPDIESRFIQGPFGNMSFETTYLKPLAGNRGIASSFWVMVRKTGIEGYLAPYRKELACQAYRPSFIPMVQCVQGGKQNTAISHRYGVSPPA